jgi:hypothetical protein
MGQKNAEETNKLFPTMKISHRTPALAVAHSHVKE